MCMDSARTTQMVEGALNVLDTRLACHRHRENSLECGNRHIVCLVARRFVYLNRSDISQVMSIL